MKSSEWIQGDDGLASLPPSQTANGYGVASIDDEVKRRPAIRVGVVDDDAHVRLALRYILQGADDCSCAGIFSSAARVLVEIPRVRPHVVLIGVPVVGRSGIDCIKRLKLMMPSLRIVIMSGFLDSSSIEQSREAGADNYLMKPVSAGQCLAMLRFMMFGATEHRRKSPAFPTRHASTLSTASLLTPRENEVMRYFAEGLLYKEVAERLGITYSAVHNYQHKIYAKLGASNKTEAIVRWQQHCRSRSNVG